MQQARFVQTASYSPLPGVDLFHITWRGLPYHTVTDIHYHRPTTPLPPMRSVSHHSPLAPSQPSTSWMSERTLIFLRTPAGFSSTHATPMYNMPAVNGLRSYLTIASSSLAALPSSRTHGENYREMPAGVKKSRFQSRMRLGQTS